MGPAHTPRHRLERERPLLADLRRRAAAVVVGRDLYADDLVLRAERPQAAEVRPESARADDVLALPARA